MAQPDIRATVRSLILGLQRWQASNRQPAARGPASGAVRVDVVMPPPDADQRRRDRAREQTKPDAEKPPTAQQRVERIARERQSTQDRDDLWLQQQKLGAGVLSSYTPAGLLRARIATTAFQQFGGAGIVGSQIANQALGGSQTGRFALKAGGAIAQAVGAAQAVGPFATSFLAPIVRDLAGETIEQKFRENMDWYRRQLVSLASQVAALSAATEQTKEIAKARLVVGGDKAKLGDLPDIAGAFHAVASLEQQKQAKVDAVTSGRVADALTEAMRSILASNYKGYSDDVRKAISGAARMN